MIDGIQLKVCGLSSLVDAEWADKCGMDYLGFNFYPKSPRYVSHAQYAAMDRRLPERKRVAVCVEPSADELRWFIDQGFDRFQIHYRRELPPATIAAWSELITVDKLWLAPKVPPGSPFPTEVLPLARTFLIDTFQADKFGGTGKTGDWGQFRQLKQTHPDRTWILSGGLNPENVGEALNASGARLIDVNSGIESAPGVKDLTKMKAFCAALHRARTGESTPPS
jgi:phosphoribosylanthranilate isomerase